MVLLRGWLRRKSDAWGVHHEKCEQLFLSSKISEYNERRCRPSEALLGDGKSGHLKKKSKLVPPVIEYVQLQFLVKWCSKWTPPSWWRSEKAPHFEQLKTPDRHRGTDIPQKTEKSKNPKKLGKCVIFHFGPSNERKSPLSEALLGVRKVTSGWRILKADAARDCPFIAAEWRRVLFF